MTPLEFFGYFAHYKGILVLFVAVMAILAFVHRRAQRGECMRCKKTVVVMGMPLLCGKCRRQGGVA